MARGELQRLGNLFVTWLAHLLIDMVSLSLLPHWQERSRMKRENLTPLLHVLTWGAVLAVSLLTRATLPMPKHTANQVFWLLFLIGMAIFAWALAYLKGGLFGRVEPALKSLVMSGPYRWVRHPVYLSTVIVTLGLAVGIKSLWGLIGTWLLFVPAGVYRARLEEQALEAKFGQEWKDYARRTGFMLPRMW